MLCCDPCLKLDGKPRFAFKVDTPNGTQVDLCDIHRQQYDEALKLTTAIFLSVDNPDETMWESHKVRLRAGKL